jgi:membrane protease YdiL (CAAX protease family)
VLTAALAITTFLGFWNSLFLAFLLELLPVLAVVQIPLLGTGPVPRIPAYVGSGLVILSLGLLGLGLGSGVVGVSAMGLDLIGWSQLATWTVVLTVAAMALVGVFHLLGNLLGVRESRMLLELLPRTRGEKLHFTGLSLCAGFGEEMAYRGYAIAVLTPIVGNVWGVAVLSSCVFGLLHAYQGALGVVRTGLLGLILAASFILSGSLWPAIIAHATVDLIGGLVLGERMLGSLEEEPISEADMRTTEEE